jgi:hypothetical protein
MTNMKTHTATTRLALVALLCGACWFLPGCASYSSTGSMSTWDLLMMGGGDSWKGIRDTSRLLEGGNDLSDVATTARLLMAGPEEGFDVIRNDLRKTFAPPFNFDELRMTLRLLR